MNLDSEIIGAILGPIITALIAGLAYGVQHWRSLRRWEDERQKALQQASEEVKFIDTWLSALGRLADIDPDYEAKAQRALQDLERSYHAMAVELADDGPRPRRRTLIQHLGALLLVPLHRGTAKMLRAFYWLSLLLGTLWTIALIATIGEQVETEGWAIALFALMFLVAVGLLPALGFYLWARYVDRERVRPVAAGIRPTAPVTGWPPPAMGASGSQPPFTGPFQGYPPSVVQDPVRGRRP